MSEDLISEKDFAVLIERAGLTLDEKQSDDLRKAYAFVREMVARVRAPRGREAEPAHIFVLPKPEA